MLWTKSILRLFISYHLLTLWTIDVNIFHLKLVVVTLPQILNLKCSLKQLEIASSALRKCLFYKVARTARRP